MNVLLITLQRDLAIAGLKQLHYYLREHGVTSVILQLPAFDKRDIPAMDNVVRFIREHSPGLIAVSLMSNSFFEAAALTRYIKKHLDTPVLWGGIHPSAQPEECLEFADWVCVGEGERTLLAVAKAIENHQPVTDIPNLCYRRDGQLVRSELYPLIENLDDLPVPHHIPENYFLQAGREILPVDRKLFTRFGRHQGRTYDILSSRGCPFSCTYCANSVWSGLYGPMKIRRRSVGSVLAELRQAREENPGVQFVNFLDDCFLACDEEYLREFCGRYRREIALPLVVRCIPLFLTPEKMRLLKDAGLAWINLGLQSGSDRVNREVFRRRSMTEDFLRAARLVHEHRVAPIYDVILDSPFESEEDRLATIRALMETPKPYYTELFSMCLYPGTQLLRRTREAGLPVEDTRAKDMFAFRRDTLNDLTRMACYLSPRRMEKLLALYAKNPRGLRFRFAKWRSWLLCVMLAEPLACFRVVKLSQGGSFWRTLGAVKSLSREWLDRYFKVLFRGRVHPTLPPEPVPQKTPGPGAQTHRDGCCG